MKVYVYPSKKKVGKKKTTPKPTIDNDEPDEIDDPDECEEDTDTPDDEFELEDEDEDEDVDEEFYMGRDYDESDSQEEQMQFGSVPRQSNFMPSFSGASEPSTSKVPKKKPKFTLQHGWRLSKQRLIDINMVLSPSQPNTPG